MIGETIPGKEECLPYLTLLLAGEKVLSAIYVPRLLFLDKVGNPYRCYTEHRRHNAAA